MPPQIFFICLGGIIAVIAAAVITELARPWPTRQEREKKEKIQAKKLKRQMDMQDRAEQLRKMDEEKIQEPDPEPGSKIQEHAPDEIPEPDETDFDWETEDFLPDKKT